MTTNKKPNLIYMCKVCGHCKKPVNPDKCFVKKWYWLWKAQKQLVEEQSRIAEAKKAEVAFEMYDKYLKETGGSFNINMTFSRWLRIRIKRGNRGRKQKGMEDER